MFPGGDLCAGPAERALTAGGYAQLLVCPVCAATLAADAKGLRCARGHCFDRARAGYYDLLPVGHGRSKRCGDTREMLAARRRFLEGGHFAPIATALADLVAAKLTHPPERQATRSPRQRGTRARPHPALPGFAILDVGCGEGYYLGCLREAPALQDVRQELCWIGVDRSTAALRLAARRHREIQFLVNDVHHRLCVADARVAVLLSVFAPRNAPEFARVLRSGGLLAVVIPDAWHLHELRASVPLLAVHPGKREALIHKLRAHFVLSEERCLRYERAFTSTDLADLLLMTPNRRHLCAREIARVAERPRAVTVSVRLLGFDRR